MNASLLNVLHDSRDQDIFPIAQRVDIYLSSVLEEAIDKDRTLHRKADGLLHVTPYGLLCIGNDHGTAAQNIRRSDENGKSQRPSHLAGLFDAGRCTVRRRRNLQVSQKFSKQFPVLCEIDVAWVRSDDRQS